jgi:hypothetical protein
MRRAARLFRIVWRINAIVILAAGLLLCVAAIAVLVVVVHESTRDRAAHDSARVEPEVVKGDVFELGNMSRLRGTPVMLLELTSRQRYAGGSYSKDATSVRNLLFYDSESGKTTWLFTQYGLLAGIRPLAEHGDDKGRIRWVLLEQVTQDSNRDGRLTLQDVHTLGVVDADGQNYKDLMSNVVRVLGVEFLSDAVVDIAVSVADADYIVEIDLPRREVRRRTLLRYHQARD